MSDIQNKPALNSHIQLIYGLAIILLVLLWIFQWIVGLIMTIPLILSFFYTVRKEKSRIDQTEAYISSLSHRIKRVGEEALLEMPFGIILYNDHYKIDWANPYMNQYSEESLVGESLNVLSEDIIPMIKENKEEVWVDLGENKFLTLIKKDERLLYFLDRTKQVELQNRYEDDQTVLAIIYLDNYEEITKTMDDTAKSQLNSEVTSILSNWANEYGLYLKRTSQARFLAVGTRKILQQLEKAKFDILDVVREYSGEQNNPITLSIGIGNGNVPLPVLGELAQSSLDLALGRGGDQVAIKEENGKVRFYGGKTNPMEKRTRVRARVISHALTELVKASDKVIIMGHKAPDMDSIGSAIGILNIAKANDVNGYIVFDQDDIDKGVQRLVESIKRKEELWQSFIEPGEAEEIITSQSLVVVVDTHKPSMAANEKLLEMTDYKVIIDHHRRGEEFIDNPTLVYMEPYASSTAELVTELLEYQPKTLKLSMLEATALLAGIIVDTKSFTLRTGSRTFDAASFLRSKGADTVLVQQFMKEDLDLYIKRSKLIEKAQIYYNQIAIAKGDPGTSLSPVLIAQAADTLLTLTGIEASFVISEREDGRIGISARSLGKINVQIIMEELDGGGHLTNAATQIENITIDEAEARLKAIIQKYWEGREE
ncbi:cyclic-di-AMP phosphodiesterase GdpP [Compostibacillus humi]|uniref:Cyclic-di-AMP phosphodiesterase n=1 Tax=Compostibacillus humi TaxID=1245525 RepID=A0A8J2TNV2_9BACI|nr:DHH family phosphoesterase [Compostibacillus humi]GFZ78560.1 cyclic-di-AMP phosphodiesterase GdpP [Compostibacillus humi]